MSGLRAAAGARRHRGHGGEGGGGGVARRVLQLRGLRRRARRPPLLLLLRHGPDLLRQASVWFCNVGIDVKRCCTVHTFHTQESIKIENLKLKTPRQALRGSARDPALRGLRRAHLRGGVCARGAPPLARTALLLLVVRPAARRHQVRHNTRAANEISQNGNGKGNETLNMEFIQNSPKRFTQHTVFGL